MKKKVDAHENLFLLSKRDSVTLKMTTDGSKEQTLGSFSNKCEEADFHIK